MDGGRRAEEGTGEGVMALMGFSPCNTLVFIACINISSLNFHYIM